MLRPLSGADLRRAARLRLVHKLGAGVNTIDVETATKQGIAVANMPGANAPSVAEGTVLLMLAALRRRAAGPPGNPCSQPTDRLLVWKALAETKPERMGRRPMPIAITPEHQDLADSVRSLVARVAPSEVLHAALETPIENPPPYWQAAADQGLQGVHLAESVGGQGFGILELAIVLAEFGYGAVPGPFVPSAIASALICCARPGRQGARRTGVRRGHRRLRAGFRADRHPARPA